MYCSNIVGSQSPESFGPEGRCPSLGTVDVCGGSRRCDECVKSLKVIYKDTYRALTTQPKSYYNPRVHRVVGPELCPIDGCYGVLVLKGTMGNVEYRFCRECGSGCQGDANRPWDERAIAGVI